MRLLSPITLGGAFFALNPRGGLRVVWQSMRMEMHRRDNIALIILKYSANIINPFWA